MKDYYNILGLQEGADDEAIRQAYKRLAMKHHPDRGGDSAQFQEIQEAYATLSDPAKRAQWQQQRHFQHDGGPFSFSFNFGGPDINDIIRNFGGVHFGQGFRQNTARNRDLRVVMDLDLASTLESQVKHVEIRNPDGSTRTVQVNVPRGVTSNMQMRFPGHGENHIKNVQPGDLYVEFRVHPAAGFTVNGIHLHKRTMINAIDAILGTSVNVSGLDGKMFTVNVPAGTQPNAQLRIPSQGLWDSNHPVKGDLFLEVLIEIPARITADQLERLQRSTV